MYSSKTLALYQAEGGGLFSLQVTLILKNFSYTKPLTLGTKHSFNC